MQKKIVINLIIGFFSLFFDSSLIAQDNNILKKNVSLMVAALSDLNHQDEEQNASNCSQCNGYCIFVEHLLTTHFNNYQPDTTCSTCKCPEEQTYCFHTDYSNYLFNVCRNRYKCSQSDCTFECTQHMSFLNKDQLPLGEFICHTCGYQGGNKIALTRHFSRMHKMPKIKLFRCSHKTCNEIFTSDIDRRQHASTHFISSNKSYASKNHSRPTLECSLCPFKTTNQSCLDHHEKHHPQYSCPHENCLFTTPNHYEMIWHVNARGSFVCTHLQNKTTPCNKVFYTEALLKLHQEKHKHLNLGQTDQSTIIKKTFECPVCHCSFMGAKWLENHKQRNKHF